MSKKIKLHPQDKRALEEVKLLIERSAEIPTIDQLSRKAGLNQDKLKKGFKLLFGVSPYNYHIQIKMQLAKSLLLNTDRPVYEIAWDLGYNHSSNFCIEFKRWTGERPVRFREGFRG